ATVRNQVGRERPENLTHRVDVAQRGRLLEELGGERLEPVVFAQEEDGLLCREVAEERARRHARSLRDRLGRRRVVALLGEEIERGLLQLALRAVLVRLATRGLRCSRGERLGQENAPARRRVVRSKNLSGRGMPVGLTGAGPGSYRDSRVSL